MSDEHPGRKATCRCGKRIQACRCGGTECPGWCHVDSPTHWCGNKMSDGKAAPKGERDG